MGIHPRHERPPDERETAAPVATGSGGKVVSGTSEFSKATTREQVAARAIGAALHVVPAAGSPGHRSTMEIAEALAGVLRPLSIPQRLVLFFAAAMSLPGSVLEDASSAVGYGLIAWRSGPVEAEKQRQAQTYRRLSAEARRAGK